MDNVYILSLTDGVDRYIVGVYATETLAKAKQLEITANKDNYTRDGICVTFIQKWGIQTSLTDEPKLTNL